MRGVSGQQARCAVASREGIGACPEALLKNQTLLLAPRRGAGLDVPRKRAGLEISARPAGRGAADISAGAAVGEKGNGLEPANTFVRGKLTAVPATGTAAAAGLAPLSKSIRYRFLACPGAAVVPRALPRERCLCCVCGAFARRTRCLCEVGKQRLPENPKEFFGFPVALCDRL